jgi:hypothetical protein
MDITKCVGTDCSHKETCYRYTAPVTDFRQSWFCECPLKSDGSCDMYWGKNAERVFNQLKDIVNGKS